MLAVTSRIWDWSERHPWLLIAMLTLMVRIPTFQNKVLGPDENIWATQALDWSLGGVPCVTTWDSKPPTFIAIYRLAYAIWPAKPLLAAHVLLAAAVIGLCGVVCAVGRELAGSRAGLASGLTGVLLLHAQLHCDNRFSDLMACETEPFQMLLVSLGLWAAIRWPQSRAAWLVSGVAICLSAQMRQSSGLFLIMPLVVAVALYRRVPGLWHLAAFAVGVAAAAAPLLIYYARLGALGDLYFCLVEFPSQVNNRSDLTKLPFRSALMLSRYLSASGIAVALACGMLLTPAGNEVGLRKTPVRRLSLVLVLWAALGFISISLTSQFFSHYFIQVAPPLCLLAGVGYIIIFPTSRSDDAGPTIGPPGQASRVADGALLAFVAVTLIASSLFVVDTWRSGALTDGIKAERDLGHYIASRADTGDRLLVWAAWNWGKLNMWSGLRPAVPDFPGVIMATAASRTPGSASAQLGPKPDLTGGLYRNAAALQDYIGNELVATPPRFVVKHSGNLWLDDQYPFIERFVRERYRLIHTQGPYEVYELALP